ncbi:MAG: hypothetical protein M3071_02075 [Actinomycetota bacterium]|nr:hypothetical protein [Actinomycetota bacterium]
MSSGPRPELAELAVADRDAGGFRQGFRRLGPAILELAETPDASDGVSTATFWGPAIAFMDPEP